VLPEDPLKRRISSLHSPPLPITREPGPRLIPQIPAQLHRPPPRGRPHIQPAVPPRLDDRLDAPRLQEPVHVPRVVGPIPVDLGHPHVPLRLLHQPRQRLHVVHVVGADLHGDHLMGHGVDGEVELHDSLLLPVLPLYPAPGLVDADAGAVDRDGDGLVGFS